MGHLRQRKKGRSKLLESLALLRPFGDSFFKRSHSLGRKQYSVYTGFVMPLLQAWWSLLFFHSAGIWAWKRLHKPYPAWHPTPSGHRPDIPLFPSYGFLSLFPRIYLGNSVSSIFHYYYKVLPRFYFLYKLIQKGTAKFPVFPAIPRYVLFIFRFPHRRNKIIAIRTPCFRFHLFGGISPYV